MKINELMGELQNRNINVAKLKKKKSKMLVNFFCQGSVRVRITLATSGMCRLLCRLYSRKQLSKN